LARWHLDCVERLFRAWFGRGGWPRFAVGIGLWLGGRAGQERTGRARVALTVLATFAIAANRRPHLVDETVVWHAVSTIR
jgi:hypothetical protein